MNRGYRLWTHTPLSVCWMCLVFVGGWCLPYTLIVTSGTTISHDSVSFVSSRVIMAGMNVHSLLLYNILGRINLFLWFIATFTIYFCVKIIEYDTVNYGTCHSKIVCIISIIFDFSKETSLWENIFQSAARIHLFLLLFHIDINFRSVCESFFS